MGKIMNEVGVVFHCNINGNLVGNLYFDFNEKIHMTIGRIGL